MASTWKPWGACRVDGVPGVGALVADEHVVWQVVEVVDLSCESECPSARTHCVVLESRTGSPRRRRVPTNRYGAWWTYPGRYPVCSCCGEPAPCRAQLVEDTTRCEMARMCRFEMPGVCPACGCPVTQREEAVTFEDNLEVPLGPPVTFHLRSRGCRSAAVAYQCRWLAADPGRVPLLPGPARDRRLP